MGFYTGVISIGIQTGISSIGFKAGDVSIGLQQAIFVQCRRRGSKLDQDKVYKFNEKTLKKKEKKFNVLIVCGRGNAGGR